MTIKEKDLVIYGCGAYARRICHYFCNLKYIAEELFRRDTDIELIWGMAGQNSTGFPKWIKRDSTDGTKELLERHAATDSRIRLLSSEVKGYGHQRNLALQMNLGFRGEI